MSSLKVKISCLLACLAPATMMNAFAAEVTDAGYYAGFMLGPTKSSGSGNSNSFGGRVFGGYEANSFISYEVGVVAYPQSSADSTGSGCTSSNQRVVYLDALLKGSMPLGGGGIYTKVGAATNINPPFLNSCEESDNMSKIYPVVDVGAYFDLSEGIVADISWNRLATSGVTKYIDLYAIGFSYHFI